MVPLEQEQNLEVMREQAIWLREELKRERLQRTKLQDIIALSKEQWLGPNLKDQLHRLQKKFFGFGRENLKSRKDRPVGHEQASLKLHGERCHKDEDSESDQDKKTDGNKTTKDPAPVQNFDFKPEELREESTVRGVNGNEQAWNKISGLTQDSVEITVTERVYTRVVHKRAKYRLKDEYNTTGKEVIITAPGPAKLKSGCQYSIDFAVAVVCDKFEYHLPLERQRRKMQAGGLDVDVKTLFSLTESVSDHCREGKVIEGIRTDILRDFCAAHLDETTWMVLGSGKKSYMWTLSNRAGSYYQFEPTRSGLIAKEMLKGYTGAVISDGYGGYNRVKGVEGIRSAHCWSHARREFTEREDDFPSEVPVIVKMIDDLFEIEAKAKSFDALKLLRITESKPLIDEIKKWLWETKARFMPGEGIVKAVDYSLNRWKELTLFLKDLSVPLSNNDAERAARHAVLGRKNFAGSRTINGADVAATLYTVIETCKKVGLQPAEYFKYVITERWDGRQPKTPLQFSLDRFGKNDRLVFPPKDEWQVEAP